MNGDILSLSLENRADKQVMGGGFTDECDAGVGRLAWHRARTN